MTSLTRSSITGLYHPKRSLDSIGSSSSSNSSVTDNQKFLSRKSSAVDRILNADKSGWIDQSNNLLNEYFSFILRIFTN